MQINAKGSYFDFVKFSRYISAEDLAEIGEKAAQAERDFYALEIGEFFECLQGDFSCVGVTKETAEDLTTAQFFWCSKFPEFLEGFCKALKTLTPKANAQAQKAASACLPMTLQESMLIFAREYFGLRSFDEAARVTLGDFLLAKKDNYNKETFAAAYNANIGKK